MYLDKSSRPAMSAIEANSVSKHLSADVVIVGGGHAGNQCALAAVEAGASVIVIESQTEDSMRWVGEQIGAVNSKFHIERGFGPYDTTEIAEEYYRCTSYLANYTLIKKFLDNSGEMIDHMMKLVPEDSTLLDDENFNIHEAYGKPRYPVVVGGHKTWAATMQFRGPTLQEYGGPTYKYQGRGSDYNINERSRLSEFEMLALKRSRELGADWQFGVKAISIAKTGDRVTTIYAKDKMGTIAAYTAKAGVVLACGGGATGLDLGLWAGGITEQVVDIRNTRNNVRSGMGFSTCLTLNANGERFMNESIPYAIPFSLSRQPKGILCCVTDSKFMQQLRLGGLQHGNPDFGRPEMIAQFEHDMGKVKAAGKAGHLVRDCGTSEREKYRFFGADTLDELADYLGYTGQAKKNMLASVKRYNEMSYAGKDTDFNKDPNTLIPVDEGPFYAVLDLYEPKNMRGSNTPLGLRTDDDFNVLNENYDPVSGLYAIGNCMGGRFGTYYPTPFGGVYIGSAMTHGRLLGKYLALEVAR